MGMAHLPCNCRWHNCYALCSSDMSKIFLAMHVQNISAEAASGFALVCFLQQSCSGKRCFCSQLHNLSCIGGPALGLFFGMLCLPNTPNSLAEMGRPDEALQVLQRVRGTSNVHAEFASIQAAADYSMKVRLTDAPCQMLPSSLACCVLLGNTCMPRQ